ncbi:pilus assembly protein [Brevibacterium sp. 50QC2O2]|uniref:TadE family type IV pilus minor pilin n=1 Tax=unclassified Brevibacterium TaxID=2614124 RepID=UPI00211CD2C3|nr:MULTISPECIES: TadE family type IV pilus minor pilin [unclassified Brevibacterium]MCQ9368617.1 pilus assembly protein [Brevibacterium sp. 91QC2O2]MCQ9387225.1 pilus assembly protein [Brevibacterium sp. 50QC2O2]
MSGHGSPDRTRTGGTGAERITADRAGSAGARSDRGAAAAEFAMIMPAIVLIILMVLGTATIGLTQLQAYEAARAGAREAARGEASSAVTKAAQAKAGSSAAVKITRDGEYTRVSVEIGLPKSLHFIKQRVDATAEARTEGGSGS